MKDIAVFAAVLAFCGGALYAVSATNDQPAAAVEVAAQAQPVSEVVAQEPAVCFESRKGATEITRREIAPDLPNVKCSTRTGAVLWYGDPYEGSVPMGQIPLVDEAVQGEAVVRPRSEKLNLLATCSIACHNGVFPPGFPADNRPVPIPTMEGMLPEIKNLQHGRGRIWCLDCHHPTQRNMLVDHFGDPISFDQPQLLCGKCHGDKLRDWRDGIHGKRIGEFASDGKKRWFVCTECHSAHDVQDGERNRGFARLQPEAAPQLTRGMKDAAHEKLHPIPH